MFSHDIQGEALSFILAHKEDINEGRLIKEAKVIASLAVTLHSPLITTNLKQFLEARDHWQRTIVMPFLKDLYGITKQENKMIDKEAIALFSTNSTDQYEVVLEVTAADYNGKDFDGSPLVTHYCAEGFKVNELLGNWFTSDIVSINQSGGTDYARWDVRTPSGVKVAEPGDAIVYKDDTLDVVSQPTFTKSK